MPGPLSDKTLNNLLNKIYSGRIDPRHLPKDIYLKTAKHLSDGLFKGLDLDLKKASKAIKKGSVSGLGAGDLELMEQMRQNVYMFSAAKTYQQVRELSALTVDKDGVLRNKNEFMADAKKVVTEYNKNWLNTEWETCVGQGQNAVKWFDIQANADILPLLQYVTIGEEHACSICRPLDGITALWNDPIWRKIMPLNHFRCRCLVKQLSKSEARQSNRSAIDRAYNSAMEKMDDTFKMNPGIDGYVFGPKHPYFSVAKKDKALAKNNFGLPIPAK